MYYQVCYIISEKFVIDRTTAEAWKMGDVHEIGVSGIALACMLVLKILSACTFSTVCRKTSARKKKTLLESKFP